MNIDTLSIKWVIAVTGTLFLFFGQVAAQTADDQTLRYAHFIIKEHWVQTQRLADSLVKGAAEAHRERLSIPNGPKPPLPPPPAVFDRKRNTHFIVEPEQYIFYSIVDEFSNDSILRPGISNIYRINGESQKLQEFNANSFEMWEEYNLPYKSDELYQLLEENKNVRKEICGYDCYQVLLKNTLTQRPVELYVTEEIQLEYHPVLNVKKYLSKYYPLYIRYYNADFPEDEYREYRFYKYR